MIKPFPWAFCVAGFFAWVPIQSRGAASPQDFGVRSVKEPVKGRVFMPEGDLFRPLLADPKEVQFFMSYGGYRSPSGNFTGWFVGFGETLGIVKWVGKNPAEGLQFSLEAGVLAQFNWSASSKDLINADYLVGSVLSYRRRANSVRLRFFHQSSHLGDEFLLSTSIARVNLSYEAMDLVASREWRWVRVYGGGRYLITTDPEGLGRRGVQAGSEFVVRRAVKGAARPVLAVDVKWNEEQHWRRSFSAKAGVELSPVRADQRHIRLLAEFYNGFSPYGQFFNANVQFAGLGLYLGF